MDYKESGVDIEAGTRAVDLIKKNVKKTFNPSVLNGLGGFAAMYELPKYNNPVLVSCTDGVGTKLRLAIECGVYNTVGIDLVAMSVNDMICCGAKPLFFLDYIAFHKNEPEQTKDIVDGIVEGCLQSECALIGGEMAEMNDMYQPGDFDLAGFSVGVVEKEDRIDGSKIAPGQYVYALKASGFHSNGYSLVRKVCTDEKCEAFGIDKKELLTPTTIYVKQILALIQKHNITGIAHITGGGLAENLERVTPNNVDINIDQPKIQTPEIFKKVQQAGDIQDSEMFKVFNMGVGMIVISEDPIEETNDLYQIATVTPGSGSVKIN
jgi:phosphoribosylformylglycinamidine cyclo-ligase